MNLKRYFATALLVGLLAACGGDTADTTLPGTLSEAETNAALSDLSSDLIGTILSMNGDASSVALQNLPVKAANFPLSAQESASTLPRGRYAYDEAADAWQLDGEADDLILTWTYSGVDAEAEATLTADWDAGGDTLSVTGPEGETLEAPAAFNLTLVAAEQEVANVDLALSYYNADGCGAADGVAEPTSLSVDGTGSLFDLENVGFSISDEDGTDTVTTQGEVSLAQDAGAVLRWTINLEGERERSDCFTSGYAPTGGDVNVSLDAGAGSFALGVNVDSVDLEGGSASLSGGTLRINDQLAVSFAGTLDDSNGNGVPGENVTLTFADGQSVTLEQALQSSKLGMMMRGLR